MVSAKCFLPTVLTRQTAHSFLQVTKPSATSAADDADGEWNLQCVFSYVGCWSEQDSNTSRLRVCAEDDAQNSEGNSPAAESEDGGGSNEGSDANASDDDNDDEDASGDDAAAAQGGDDNDDDEDDDDEEEYDEGDDDDGKLAA